MKAKLNHSRRRKKVRHDFLLTFFPDYQAGKTDYKYMETQINGYYLVRQYNANNQAWEVAIYDPESFLSKKHLITKEQGLQGSLHRP